MAIVSHIATKIIDDLGSRLIEEIGLVLGVKNELEKLKESLSRIKAILLDAEKKAATNHEVKDWLGKLKDIAYDAEDLLDEVATNSLRKKVEQDVLDEVAKEALRQGVELPKKIANQVRSCFTSLVGRCFSGSNQLVFRSNIAHRIEDIIERLDRTQKDDVCSTFRSIPDQCVDIDDEHRRHTDPSVIETRVFGREKDKEVLVKLLTTSSPLSSNGGNNVMVIPIIGIGGLGKTTLAHHVYDDDEVKKHFDPRMWVCVSFDFNVDLLAKKILESMTTRKCDGMGAVEAKSSVREKLSGKRYLLVLDDVWTEDRGEWEKLSNLLKGGGAASGSVIMVTTRSEKVASIMQPDKSLRYSLKELNENVCQSLFNEWAFGRNEIEANHPDQELVKIGKEIVKKCGGVPLAAKALGGLLSHTRYEKDWLDVLKTEIWNLEDENEILPALRISYDQLPSHLKQCFAYCSLFPQDHEIKVDDLIHQWMAHGFIQLPPPSRRGESPLKIEDIGHRYFKELLWRSFFQEPEKDKLGNIVTCKMHDLVHNLARLVTGKEWWEIADSSSSSSSIPKGVRHMVMFHEEGSDPTTLIQRIDDDNAKRLRTLYLQCNFYYHTEWVSQLGDGFFSGFRGLRVLNLSDLRMEHVPSSIGDLQHLRYLNLSRNNFKALPNFICRLYNLQTLILNDCLCLDEWPRDITKMVSLRHLGLGLPRMGIRKASSLRYMPRGLGQLTSLNTLGMFMVIDPNNPTILERDLMVGRLGELHGLNQLRGTLQIFGLKNVRDVRDAEEANLKEKSELQSLELVWDYMFANNRCVEDQEVVLRNLQPHPNLKALALYWYCGAKMPTWIIRSSSLPCLVELRIEGNPNLKCLPLIGEFPCLKHLHLDRLEALKSIHNKVMGGGVKPLVLFPLLETLEIVYVENLERWTISIGEGEGEGEGEDDNNLHLLSSMFPRLTVLVLFRCLELTTLPIHSVGRIQHLTSLRYLEVVDFPRLVSLPDYLPATLEKLKIKECYDLVRLPDCFFEDLKLLSEFEISKCTKLTNLPEGIQHLTALKRLTIGGCPGLITLPQGLGNLSSLQALTIHGCSNLSSIPEGIRHLTSLNVLRIWECPSLITLPQGLGNLSSLQELSIEDCSNLSSLPEGIRHLTSLKMLKISDCPGLITLPLGLGNLSSLQELKIRNCSNLSSPPEGIRHLTSLKMLQIGNFPGLITLPQGLGNLSSLRELEISNCSNLTSLSEGIRHLTSLKMLEIRDCPGLITLPQGLGNLSSLQELKIWKCSNLSSLPEGIRHLTSLKMLEIENCPGLITLPQGLGNLSSLRGLKISNCSNLSSLPEHLNSLKYLRIHSCPCLRALPDGLESLASHGVLEISNCPNLSLQENSPHEDDD